MNVSDYYKSMSHDQKIIFWQITTNVFLVFFTFWMGLFVQDFVADKNAKLSQELIRFDYVDRIYPTYKNVANNEVMDSLWQYTLETQRFENDSKKRHESLMNAANYIQKNQDKVSNWATNMCTTLSDFKYYLNKKDFDSISNNNAEILMSLKLLSLCQDSVMTPTLFKDKLESYLYSTEFRHAAYVSTGVKSVGALGHDLYTLYNSGDPLLKNKINQYLINYTLIPIIKNAQIMEEAILYRSKVEYKFNFLPWIYLFFSLIIGIIISVIFARFIITKQGVKYVSTVDYKKLEKRTMELEGLKIISEEEIKRYNTSIDNLNKTIETKNQIIKEDIDVLSRLRTQIKELGENPVV